MRETPVAKEALVTVYHDFDEDPMGPFGTGPAVDDGEPWVDPIAEGFGEDGVYGPIAYTDPIYEQFGDYDAFGPFAWRNIDYFAEEEERRYSEGG